MLKRIEVSDEKRLCSDGSIRIVAKANTPSVGTMSATLAPWTSRTRTISSIPPKAIVSKAYRGSSEITCWRAICFS